MSSAMQRQCMQDHSNNRGSAWCRRTYIDNVYVGIAAGAAVHRHRQSCPLSAGSRLRPRSTALSKTRPSPIALLPLSILGVDVRQLEVGGMLQDDFCSRLGIIKRRMKGRNHGMANQDAARFLAQDVRS